MPARWLVASSVALALFLAACGGSSASGPAAPAASQNDGRLAGRTFLSVSVTDGDTERPLVAGTRITISFRAQDLSANAGCNTMGGSYRVDGGTLVLDGMATTDMGCPNNLGTQDAWLGQFLGSKPSLVLSGTDLALTSGSVTIKLQDRTVADPDRPLAGPTWTVESIISGDVVASVPLDVHATLVIHPDGTLDLFAGCNEGGGQWSLNGTTFVIGDLALTKRACTGAAGSLETAVLGVLQSGAIQETIQADVLTLQAGANGIQLRAS